MTIYSFAFVVKQITNQAFDESVREESRPSKTRGWQSLEFIADQRLAMLGLPKIYNAKNPFSFMDLQDVQELANFFERRVSAYQVAVAGEVSFSEAF